MQDEAAHPISADIIAQANKLMGACEQMRDDAQERSKKAQRDHRLEDCLKAATDIFDDAKKNVDTKEGHIDTKNGWFHVEKIFIEARNKFDYLFKVRSPI